MDADRIGAVRGGRSRAGIARYLIKKLVKAMAALGLLSQDLENRLLRSAMVIIFWFFGYTKWHQYAVQQGGRTSLQPAAGWPNYRCGSGGGSCSGSRCIRNDRA